jgi:hypothetical protein
MCWHLATQVVASGMVGNYLSVKPGLSTEGSPYLPVYHQAQLREADDNPVIFVKFREKRGRGRLMT